MVRGNSAETLRNKIFGGKPSFRQEQESARRFGSFFSNESQEICLNNSIKQFDQDENTKRFV